MVQPPLSVDISVPTGVDELQSKISMLERALEAAEKQSGLDPLTGLANRRSFDRQLAMMESRANRDGLDIGVITFDIDGLKRVNDTSGHHAGDGVLLLTAEVLHRFCRGEDLAARLGGDEFAVLVHADRDGLTTAAVRLLEMLQNAGVPATVGWAPRSPLGGLIGALQAADLQMVSGKPSVSTDAAATMALVTARVAEKARIAQAQATGIVMMWQRGSAELAHVRIAYEADRLHLAVSVAVELIVALAAGEALGEADSIVARRLTRRLRGPERSVKLEPDSVGGDTTRDWIARVQSLVGPHLGGTQP